MSEGFVCVVSWFFWLSVEAVRGFVVDLGIVCGNRRASGAIVLLYRGGGSFERFDRVRGGVVCCRRRRAILLSLCEGSRFREVGFGHLLFGNGKI